MSVIQHLSKPSINYYLCNKYDLTNNEILGCVSEYFTKKIKCNNTALQYYYDNKDKPEYQDKLKLARSTYYQNNKSKINALHLAKYDNDPIFRENYRRYQALYSQKRRDRNINEKRGRPRKYSELE